MTPLFRTEKLVQSFHTGGRTLEILRGVDLEIGPGTCVSIRGASGSGKSTLLHLLGGLDRPAAGRIFYRESDLAGWSANRLARWRSERIGFVFQSCHLLPELSAHENVMLPAAFARRDARERAAYLLEQVGLGGRLEHRPGELSGGEQQRVALARALVNDPDVILADEPTGNLDEDNAAAVADLLLDLVGQNQKSLVLVTHDPDLAARTPHRFKLEHGHLIQL
jgi:lipoprotein-releasing system ATP-binding protein